MSKAQYKSSSPYKEDQMNLPVEDVEKAIPFYQNIMGFQLLSRKDKPVKSAVLRRDGIEIGLAENNGDPSQEGCFFEVDNIQAAIDELHKNGLKKENYEFTVEKHGDSTWKIFYIVAPDGLCYCLGEKIQVG